MKYHTHNTHSQMRSTGPTTTAGGVESSRAYIPAALRGDAGFTDGTIRPVRLRSDEQVAALPIHRLMRKMRAQYRHRGEFFFSDATVEDLYEKFCLFDHDGDRSICTSEVRLCVRCLGIRSWSDEDLRRRMTQVDGNRDEKLNFSEYVQMLLSWRAEQLDREARIKSLFERFDRDRDGSITVTEVIEVLCPAGQEGSASCVARREAIEELFASTDADNDDGISLDEFKRLYIRDEEPPPPRWGMMGSGIDLHALDGAGGGGGADGAGVGAM